MRSWRNYRTLLYPFLPFAVFLYFALSFLLHPASPLRTGQLFDPDDYMRLNEVINWLQSSHPFGAGWFDLSHPRLDPGRGVIVHWARLVDLPIALFMLPFIHAFGMQNAALIASFIVPPLLIVALLVLVSALMRPLVNNRRGDLATVFLLFAPAVLMNFMPGRVDHHAYQIMIAAFGLLALQRITLCPRGWIFSIMAAITFACGLWIGTEALPWLIIFCACLAMITSWNGGFVMRNAAVFGISLPIAVATLMPIAMLPAEYSSRALSWFSAADFIFALLAGAVFVFGWIGSRATANKWLRVALTTALGFCAAMGFVYLVPDILTGAYADYDAFFNETLIANIGEAQPLTAAMNLNTYNPASYLRAAVIFLPAAFLPCLASVIILWNFFHTSRRALKIWLTHGAFLFPALLLTVFWQVRVGWFAQIFSIMPVTWLVLHLWRCIGARFEGRQKFWAEIAAFVLIAPLPVILLPAISAEARTYPDLLLFPATHAAPACPLLHASSFLNDKYGHHPRVIMSGINEGPELLFRTPHQVIAAPYNVDGNRDAYDFFHTRTEDQAIAEARQRHVDLVLVCRTIPYFFAGLGEVKTRFAAPLYIDAQGHLRVVSSTEHPTLIERLVDNKPPKWLKPVEIPLDPDYLLFEMRKGI